MKVALIAHTVLPEKLVAASAKLCYSAASIDTVMEGLTEEKTASFVDMLADIGHESPIEHASFTFGIEGVSRSLLAQLTRHRMASYSVQSQRYSNCSRLSLYLCGERIIVNTSFSVGSGIGPEILAPVFFTVSTIFLADSSINL